VCATDFRIIHLAGEFGEGQFAETLEFCRVSSAAEVATLPPREKWNDREVGSSGPKGAADCRFALTGLRQRRHRKAVKNGPEDGKGAFQPSFSAVWYSWWN